MDHNTIYGTTTTLTTIIIVVIATYLWRYTLINRVTKFWRQDLWTYALLNDASKDVKPQVCTERVILTGMEQSDTRDLTSIKLLFYKLHNLERFPEAVVPAKRLLHMFLKETAKLAENIPEDESILSILSFSRDSLESFLHQRGEHIGKQWKNYNLRRAEGSPRELFNNREEAIRWLRQISPVKVVDGAWLGHIAKVTTPFALAKTMKGAWQILSEELGDGDLEKNHVNLYYKLLESVEAGLPRPDSPDFINTRYELNDFAVWKAAVAQLVVSLFPQEFLPEILGFNLHFEAVSMDTLRAVRELKEVGINPYYFLLHISIDNSHSGHSAIAAEIICEYMGQIRRLEGEEAAQNAWERIKSGYLLSSGLPGVATFPSQQVASDDQLISFSSREKEVIHIFHAKAQVVHGVHFCSRIRIGGRRVAEWLDPVALNSKVWQRQLLDALSSSTYWIRKGDSGRSKFIQELQWNGRMFGSFSQKEFQVLRDWIDNLSNLSVILNQPVSEEENIYIQTLITDIPSIPPPNYHGFLVGDLTVQQNRTAFSFDDRPPVQLGKNIIFDEFMPLWLSHPCVLQGFVTIPCRTDNDFACAVVRVLRAQQGFDIEHECVAGLDEFQRPDNLGLLGIGFNLMERHGYSIDILYSLQNVLQIWRSDFAMHMLNISTKPIKHKGMLVGIATAFAQMHATIATSPVMFMPSQDQVSLQMIAQRELKNLKACWTELRSEKDVYIECCQGYSLALGEIEKCFRE